MNRLFLISGIAVFVAATFLITSMPNTTMAYTCNSSSGTKNTNLQSSLTGSSGSCAVSSSVITTAHSGNARERASGPINTVGFGIGSNRFPNVPSFSGSASFPGTVFFGEGIDDPTGGGVGVTSSASSGGSQASCSSSSANSVGTGTGSLSGATTSSSSQSQPGHCP